MDGHAPRLQYIHTYSWLSKQSLYVLYVRLDSVDPEDRSDHTGDEVNSDCMYVQYGVEYVQYVDTTDTKSSNGTNHNTSTYNVSSLHTQTAS